MKKRDIETAVHTVETLAHRLPLMWWEMFNPTAGGQKEISLMVAEKQKAFVDGMLAGQTQMMREGMRMWLSPFSAPQNFTGAGTRIVEATIAPARRTVKANAKRLRKKGV
jgi:hypothetical protein